MKRHFAPISLFLASMIGGQCLAVEAGLAGPTPLVLKDGRIANVSVHTIPFIPGSSDLTSGNRAKLDSILIPAATNCFLTAQAIGHVEENADGGDDALDGHRLARARADVIQKRLTELGLPAASIASVWDWQFQIRDASATLWLFELAEGDDCDHTPLEQAVAAAAAVPAAPAVMAENGTARTANAQPQAQNDVTGVLSRQATGATASPEPAPEADPKQEVAAEDERPAIKTMLEEARKVTREMAEAEPPPITQEPLAPLKAEAEAEDSAAMKEPVQEAATAEPPAEIATELPSSVASEAPPVQAETAAAPAVEPQPVQAKAAPEGAPEPEPVQVAALSKEEAEPIRVPSAANMSVVFDMNSSWMTGRQTAVLDQLLKGMADGGVYQLTLTGAVGAGDVNAADKAEDVKYNKWMAERRIARVEDYLKQNAGGRQLQFVPEYRDGDNSRAVEVDVVPQG